ncbi:LrgA family protein [Rhodomicrobium vannielii ATCC 17100]|uniref:LrgA family protein n=1 Tax=Rhodomicrobium vannielii (strain ATCC 17100 / DSM 162 / LMG 4299 / NCIMB 10020 / ATH 3.1.1) TaxID=648757 RepID=E3I4F3_RHOVT|nr:CidA/LrgA family protein [Rhodomicrobium vannielii]ADP70468.1 LrgA family protein [Rhodomicrobium vannielii ATCC 17100]
MVEWFTVLVVFQLAGEVLSAATKLPVPGPVCGMVLLFLALVIYRRVPDGLAKTAEGLLTNLSLLFVPAGAGVMLHFGVLEHDLLPIGASLILSTLLTIAVTAALMAWLSRKASGNAPEPKPAAPEPEARS